MCNSAAHNTCTCPFCSLPYGTRASIAELADRLDLEIGDVIIIALKALADAVEVGGIDDKKLTDP